MVKALIFELGGRTHAGRLIGDTLSSSSFVCGMSETGIDPDSASPTVIEAWDNDDVDDSAMQKQLEDRFKKVKIIQREKADKEARIQQVKAEVEAKSDAIACGSEPAPVFVPPAKMQILRRPRSDDQLREEELRAKKEQEDREKAKPTLEQRQAAYDEARVRILGSDYKPEPTPPPPTQSSTSTISRNKSPEQIRVRRQSPEFMVGGPGPVPLMSLGSMGMGMPPAVNYAAAAGMTRGVSSGDLGRQAGSMMNSIQMTTQPTPQQQQAHQHQQNMANMYVVHGGSQPFMQPYHFVDMSRPPPPAPQHQQQPPMMGGYPPMGQQMSGQMNMGGSPSANNMTPSTMGRGGMFPPPANMTYFMPPMQQQQQHVAQFGRPPMSLYPPGSLSASLQFSVDMTGQSQAQRKNRGGGSKGKKTRTSPSASASGSSTGQSNDVQT